MHVSLVEEPVSTEILPSRHKVHIEMLAAPVEARKVPACVCARMRVFARSLRLRRMQMYVRAGRACACVCMYVHMHADTCRAFLASAELRGASHGRIRAFRAFDARREGLCADSSREGPRGTVGARRASGGR